MRSLRFHGWLAIAALLVLPVMAQAQEATLSGTVSDTTGGALPGVTVRAVHASSGNSFETVTDERGGFRIPVRVGAYQVTADLPGFAPVTRTVMLLVGQAAVLNLQMSVSGVQESVTVTGEAPLLDVTGSSLGGNIDPRQLEELPVSGRNWMDLVMLAPGARVNAASNLPVNPGSSRDSRRKGGDFQLNLDGQQITGMSAGSGQPRFSRDAIAEFEFLSSRFDATQGRSMAVQVNAISKSGSNTLSGSFGGYFRNDRFNAADHVAKRVLDQDIKQFSATFGGPIRRDRLHFFANYEYEREPQVGVYTTPYAHFNRDLSSNDSEKKGGGRIDAQFSSQLRLAVRGSAWRRVDNGGGSGTTTPSSGGGNKLKTTQFLGTLTQVMSSRIVNEIRVGYSDNVEDAFSLLKNPRARFQDPGRVNAPLIQLQGIVAGGRLGLPERPALKDVTFRDDLTLSFVKGGTHTMKFGAEYIYGKIEDLRCTPCEGDLDASGGPIPADVARIFPDLYDVSTWNLDLLSPVSRSFRQVFGTSYLADVPRYTTGLWVQDDWTVSPRWTLNLGVRHDVELNAFANDVEILPWLPGDRPNDVNNVSPRGGFAFTVDDRTVLRGGLGLYFGTVATAHYTALYGQTITFGILSDGRPDFASNPWNGPAPAYEQVLARACTAALEPGCLTRELPSAGPVYGAGHQMPYSYQGSIGVQRQIGQTMAVEADYVYVGTRDQPRDLRVNVNYDPATGANYPWTNVARRPYPHWGLVSMTVNGARSNLHSLQTAFTKRFSNRWQASGNYTLSYLRDAYPRPVLLEESTGRYVPVPFPTAPDMGGEYSLAHGDQRHRATVNGIWDLPYGLQLSGLYFFGSGERLDTSWGVDLRQIGGGIRASELRLRPDGTIVPRNSFVGRPVHRVDLRIQERIPVVGRVGLEGIFEVFNVFNHENYGSYVTTQVSRNYGQPSQNSNIAFAPRTLQLGFRLTF